MNYWLLKSEPAVFSLDDLAQRPQQRAVWDGVRNYQARNFLRSMQCGDLALFYHSSCTSPAAVGIVQVVHAAYPDPTARDPAHPAFDPRTARDPDRWSCVEVQLVRRLPVPYTLAQMRTHPMLADFALLRRGNRLSVLPVTPAQWERLITPPEQP